MNTQPPTPSPGPDDDFVERLLRKPSIHPAIIPDNGFTARVLHSLPPPAARRSALLTSLRPALIFAGALAGMLLHWLHTSGSTSSDRLSASLHIWPAAVLLLVDVVEWLSAPSQLIALSTVAATFGAIRLLEDLSQSSR